MEIGFFEDFFSFLPQSLLLKLVLVKVLFPLGLSFFFPPSFTSHNLQILLWKYSWWYVLSSCVSCFVVFSLSWTMNSCIDLASKNIYLPWLHRFFQLLFLNMLTCLYISALAENMLINQSTMSSQIEDLVITNFFNVCLDFVMEIPS